MHKNTLRNVGLIAQREYLEGVRSKSFKVTTIMLPGVFALVFVLVFLSSKYLGVNRHIVVATDDPRLALEIKGQILDDKDAQATVDTYATPAGGLTMADREALVGEVDKSAIDGFLWVERGDNGDFHITYDARSSADFVTNTRLEKAANQGILRWQMEQKGLSVPDVDRLMKPIDLETWQVTHGRERKSNALTAFYTAYGMALLLTMTTMIYGMNVGRSVIQEKTSRIFEVMLATARAQDLLAGKLIGVGAVGLTQIVIWIAAAATFSASGIAAQAMTGKWHLTIGWEQVVLFIVYFLLGYTLNSALFAGLGATLESEQELQQYAPLAALPVWLSFSLIALITSDPESKWVVVASLFPPCTPIIMFLRMGSQMPPAWQILLSIAFMLVAIRAVIWFSTKLYRIGILMYGKRATLPELFRWLRES